MATSPSTLAHSCDLLYFKPSRAAGNQLRRLLASEQSWDRSANSSLTLAAKGSHAAWRLGGLEATSAEVHKQPESSLSQPRMQQRLDRSACCRPQNTLTRVSTETQLPVPLLLSIWLRLSHSAP